jgi:prophage regulatory protein
MSSNAVKFLRYPELKARGIPWSRQHLATLSAAGRFPKGVLLGEKTLTYVESEIDDWSAARIAARDATMQAMEAA